MSRYTKRNIIATASLFAGLTSFGLSGAQAAEIFPQEMNSALGDHPENRPKNLPCNERNISFITGVGFFAIAGQQRRKHVLFTKLENWQDTILHTEEIIQDLEIVNRNHENRLAELALKHSIADDGTKDIALLIEQPENSVAELAVVIDLKSRRRDFQTPQPPKTPDFTSVA